MNTTFLAICMWGISLLSPITTTEQGTETQKPQKVYTFTNEFKGAKPRSQWLEYVCWYRWLSSQEILARDAQNQLLQINIKTGKRDFLVDFSKVKSPSTSHVQVMRLHLSPDRRSLLFGMGVNGTSFGEIESGVFSLKTRQIHWLPPFTIGGRMGVWAPNSKQWVYVSPNPEHPQFSLYFWNTERGAKRATTQRFPIRNGKDIVNEDSVSVHLLGFNDQGTPLFYSSTPHDISRVGTLTLKNKEAYLHPQSPITVPAGQSASAPLLSHNGKYMVWWIMTTGQNFRVTKCEMWRSDSKGENWKCLWNGTGLPVDHNYESMHWLADDSAISFIHDGSLYIVSSKCDDESLKHP